MNNATPTSLPRFRCFWSESSPNYGAGYRVVEMLDYATNTMRDVTFVTALPGKDRFARKDQAIAARIARARVKFRGERVTQCQSARLAGIRKTAFRSGG